MADEKKDDQEKKKKLKQGETEDITKKATDEEKEFKASGVEGTKDASPKPPPEGENKSEIRNPKPEIVRGEDVIKILRAKGVQI